jgi:hypothetical protein
LAGWVLRLSGVSVSAYDGRFSAIGGLAGRQDVVGPCSIDFFGQIFHAFCSRLTLINESLGLLFLIPNSGFK